MASAHTAVSTAPAAPSRCPIIDFVELTQSFLSRAFAPKTAAIARDSSTSPMGVDVPSFGEGKLAASQFKASYEQSKIGGNAQLDGDLATTIPNQLFIKLPLTLQEMSQPAMDPATGQPALDESGQPVPPQPVIDQATGQPQTELVSTENGSHRLWIITVCEGQLLKVEETVNDRSLNLELFQGFEESVIDMYSAVRHGYLQRRERLIQE